MEDVKVYDRVWIMERDKPTQKIVFAVVQSMSYFKDGVEVHYQLVNSTCGAGWGNNIGVRRDPGEVYKTKSELLESL